MTPVVSRLLVLMMVVMCAGARKPFIPGKTKPVPVTTQESRVMDANIVEFERRMAEVEKSTSVMKQEMVEVVSENKQLKEQVGSMSTTMADLNRATERVTELERMLQKFESFFGVLYNDLPDVFAREMTIEKRMTALNDYIGNRDCELTALRGNPPVDMAEPGEFPIDEELLGTAVRQLSSDNAKLKFRLDTMETRIDEPAVDRLGGAGSFNGGGVDDETAERLERLERLMALQLAPQLDEDDETSVQRLSPGDATTTKRLALSESDTDILREELDSVRSISSTRKSLFSAAAVSSSFGEDGVHKIIHFEQVLVNKGNHYQEHNSTFVCGIKGYYFVSFTVRSYDHYYLGVNLLLNGERVTSVSGESDQRKNQMMTQSIILHLTEGDQVYLTISPATNYAVYSDHSRYCTFSGFLLFKGSKNSRGGLTY